MNSKIIKPFSMISKMKKSKIFATNDIHIIENQTSIDSLAFKEKQIKGN
jgi:hypothetical protein